AGSRFNSRCGLSRKAASTSSPACQGALSMRSTTRRCRSRRYTRPTCRRWAANASVSRRFLLLPVLRWASRGHSRVLAWTAAVTRFITAKTYKSPLLSQVPTMGRFPLTPRVARSVGTIGKRASSWLSSTNSPASAFFELRQFLAGGSLLDGIATQEAVRRPIDADAQLATEATDRRAAGPDALGLEQVIGQLGIGPVGPVESLLGRPLLHPRLDLVGQVSWDFRSGPLRLAGP